MQPRSVLRRAVLVSTLWFARIVDDERSGVVALACSVKPPPRNQSVCAQTRCFYRWKTKGPREGKKLLPVPPVDPIMGNTDCWNTLLRTFHACYVVVGWLVGRIRISYSTPRGVSLCCTHPAAGCCCCVCQFNHGPRVSVLCCILRFL